MQRGIIGIGVFSEFLIGCIISIIVDHAQADKEKYAELPFADRTDVLWNPHGEQILTQS